MWKWVVGGVIVLAFVLRVANIAKLPAGFTPDEASFGYDAYSLLQTGRDQWGKAWPITFKSFGDYKLPLYTYLTIPAVAVFGLSEFAVRFPNAIFGSFAVLATYLLAKELFGEKNNEWVCVLAALFLAVSPWHTALSRGAFEANLTTFFLSMGVFVFLKARKKDNLLPLAMLFFGINLFSYHSARLVTPLVVMSLLWLFRNNFSLKKKYSLASAVFLIFFVVAIYSLFQNGGGRAATSTIFGQNLGSGNVRATVVNSGIPEVFGRIFYNEPLFKLVKFVGNYISYLSPSFLFIEGARETTYGMIPGVGLVSLFEFLGLGAFAISLIKKPTKEALFLLIWFLVGVIPVSISVGPGNAANRAAVVMPAVQIMAAFGTIYFLSLHKYLIRIPVFVFLGVVAIFGLVSFARYAYEEPSVAGYGMMNGMNELFGFLSTRSEKVILSRSLSEPHIFTAFYDHLDPVQFQSEASSWLFENKNLAWVDQQDPYTLGRYTVSTIDKIRDFKQENTLIVGKREEMPSNAQIIKTILSPARAELWVVATKP